MNESKEYASKTNYIAVVQSLQNGNVSMLKSYNKDGNYLTTMRTYGKDIQDERGLTRYKKDCGYDVYFLTGADEHGQKIAEKAKAENLSPQEYVDKISDAGRFISVCNA